MTTHEQSDWTVDSESGRSNASPHFIEVRDHITELLKTELYMLQIGEQHVTSEESRIQIVAQLIAAQLAHVLHLAPAEADTPRPDNE